MGDTGFDLDEEAELSSVVTFGEHAITHFRAAGISQQYAQTVISNAAREVLRDLAAGNFSTNTLGTASK